MTQMKNEQALLYEVLGLGRKGTLEMVYAIREAEEMLFGGAKDVGTICVTKDIYPKVAKKLKKNSRSVARQIQRLGNECWDRMDKEMKEKYLGKNLSDIRAPKDMIFYFAYYIRFGKGFYRLTADELEETAGLFLDL